VLFSNGDGTFQQPVLYPAGHDGALGNAVVADFNGDGIPDIVAAGPSGIWLFTGKGGSVFNPGVLTTAISGAFWLAPADFNGDGNLDLAVSDYPSGLGVLFGNGDGTFQAPVSIGSNTWAYVVAGDVNGDGFTDIVVPGATLYLNNGHGQFSPPIQVSVPGEDAAIGDVNGDGIPDLASSQGCVALGLGHSRFAPAVCYLVENDNGWYSVALADLRRNGLTDVVTGLNGAVSVLLNKGKGTFIDGNWTSLPGSGNCGAAADFNGDGKPDLAVPTTQGITVLLGTGKSSAPYTTGPSFAVSGVGCPITGDLNGDGIADLLVGANGLGGVGAYLGNGDGTFSLASVIPVGPAINLVLGDFNHDGKLDYADSSNNLALGNGDGTFQAPVPILANPPIYGFSWIAVGDLNNDGWPDFFATQPSYGYGALYVILNDRQGGFTLTTIADANNAPNSVMLADLNGDGNLDAVVQSDLAFATIFLGNGQGGFQPVQTNIPYPFVDPLPAQIGDVNGDSIPDLLLPADGSIGIALGTGKGTFLTPFEVGAGPGVGQVFMQNLHGQSPTAGLPDLVAPDGTGGVMVLINLTK
jgi:FG-GAP-like repeat/FG-GAP repeat